MGRQMVELAQATDHDLNQITIDGQTMWLGSSSTKDSAKKVLDRYEAYCQKNAAQPGSSWRELADKTEDTAVDHGLMKTGILRGGSATEGTILCFARTNQSKPTLKEALSSLAKTGDLGALGSVRYVYAHETDRGTVVLTAWTDETVRHPEAHANGGERRPGNGPPRDPATAGLRSRARHARRRDPVRNQRL